MSDDPKSGRQFDISIDIDARQEDVWDALTKAEELQRWFPLQAEVTPGAGGRMRWSWGDAWSGIMQIDKWDAPRFLRLVDHNARPYDVDGTPIANDATAPAASIAVTITLETVSGKTRLRLVHSGFGTGAAWDDEIDGVSTGWQYELRSLSHYLTRHRGRDRHIAWVHGSAPTSMADLWSQLVNDRGVSISAQRLEEGQPYTVTLSTGDRFSGRIQLYIPNREFAGTVTELGDGLFRVGLNPAGGRAGYTLWVASYDGDASRIQAIGSRLQQMADGLVATA
jgi:uncharacterized protein YndB with AHSA1/START domain